jgi:hypothetical protein
MFLFGLRQLGSPFLSISPRAAAQWQYLQCIQKAPAFLFVPIHKVPHSSVTSFSSRFLIS